MAKKPQNPSNTNDGTTNRDRSQIANDELSSSNIASNAKTLVDNFRHQIHELQKSLVTLEKDASAMPGIAEALELDTKIDDTPIDMPDITCEVEFDESEIKVEKAKQTFSNIDRGDWTRYALQKDRDTYKPIETYGKVRLQFLSESEEPISRAQFRLVATRADNGQELVISSRTANELGYAAIKLEDVRTDEYARLRVEVDREAVAEGEQDKTLRLEITEDQISSHGQLAIAHRFYIDEKIKKGPKDLVANSVDEPDSDDIANSPGSFGLNKEEVDGNCCLRPNSELPARQYFFRQIVRTSRTENLPELTGAGSTLGRTPIKGPVPFQGESASTYSVRAAQPMLGFVNTYRIGWFPRGRSVGELLYSLALAPCEQINLAFIDWSRSERDTRREARISSEQLAHQLHHDRTIEETVDSVLTEHQSGSSGAGGGGLSIDLGFISFGGGGGGTTSSTDGRRQLQADTVQEVSDNIVQRASAVRSQRSTVVTTSNQSESERIQTRTVRNHNRNHAMTIQYFQVISNYEVKTELVEEKPVVLIPYAIDNDIFDNIPSFNKFRVQPSRPITRFLDRHRSILRRYVPYRFRDNFDALRRLLHCRDIYGIEREFATASRWRVDLDQNYRSGVSLAIETSDGQFIPLRPLGRPQGGFAEFASDPVRLDKVESLRISFDIEGVIREGARLSLSFIEIGGTDLVSKTLSYKVNACTIIARTDISRFLPERRNIRIELDANPDFVLSNDNPSASVGLVSPDIDFSDALTQEKKDYCELKELIAHIQERPLLYLRLIWLREDPERRAMRFDRLLLGGLPLIDRIMNRPVGVSGNYIAFPLLEGRKLAEAETPQHFVSKRLVSMPTKGVFAEVFLSCCNATEKLDVDRLNTAETKCDGAAPEIAPISTGTRRDRSDTRPTDFPSPIVNIQTPPGIPDPTGLTSALNVLGTPNLFRDLSRGAELLQFINNATKEAFTSTRQHRAAMDQLAGDVMRGLISAYTGVPAGSSGGTPQAASSGTQGIQSESSDSAGAVRNTSPASSGTSATTSAIRSAGSASVRETSPSQLAAQLQNVRRAYERGQISEQQMQERTYSILGGAEGESLADQTTPLIILSTQTNTTEYRSFNPHSHDLSGIVTLEASVRNLPEGGIARWARADTSAIEITDRRSPSTQVTGIRPGLTNIDYIIDDSSGTQIASTRIPLSVPQFVTINEDASLFDPVLTTFHMDDVKQAVLEVAQSVVRTVLARVNVRTVWALPPFNESLPPHFGAGQPAENMATTVTILGNPPSPGLVGRTSTSPAVGPGHPNEQIDIFPGGYDDPSGTDVDQATRNVVTTLQGLDLTDPDLKAFGIQVFGRLFGETIAHEILHALLGFEVPTGHNSPAITGDILNNGFDRPFFDRVGIEILDESAFPSAGSYVDHGIGAINTLTFRNQQIADRFFPVPPAF